MFGVKALRKHYELIPLVGMISAAVVGAAGFSFYAVATKPDVRVDKRPESPPWERVGPSEKRKLYTPTQTYAPIPELEKLRKEIGSYKY